MIDVQPWPRLRLVPPVLGLIAVAVAGLAPLPARAASPPLAVSDEAGTWDLSFEKGNRRCRLTLRDDPSPPGFALAAPAGCHRAFPLLGPVTNWAPGAGADVLLRTADGQTVLDFGPDGGPSLSTTVGEDNVYTMIPTSAALQDRLRLASAEPALPVPAAPAVADADAGDGVTVDGRVLAPKGPAGVPEAPLPAATLSEVAGHYAVLRQSRDTGCMVTLDADERGKAELKARLAPACRDQGIVIFDPVGWHLAKGQIVLTAKKGHSVALTHRQDQTWANAPAKGAALVLKRL